MLQDPALAKQEAVTDVQPNRREPAGGRQAAGRKMDELTAQACREGGSKAKTPPLVMGLQR